MIRQPHNKFVLFRLCKSPIRMWMETGIVCIKTFIKYYFFRLSRLLLKSYHILAFRSVQMWFCRYRSGDVVLPVVIDNFTFLFVKFTSAFYRKCRTGISKLKQTNTAFADLRGSRVRSIFWDVIFQFFWIFTTKKEEDVPQLALKISPKKRKSIKRPDMRR